MTTTSNSTGLKARTKAYALEIVRFLNVLEDSPFIRVVRHQLLKAGTSVGANYRAACRAKSTADFIAKMGIVEEEADETLYWFELLVESGNVSDIEVKDLVTEGNELLAMIVASINTAKRKR